MREIEAKFYVSRLELIRRRAIRLGGRLRARRHLERNWHFDQPGDPLAEQHSLLRLREDEETTLAFKHRGRAFESRQEHELRVADSAAAAELLTALGYRVVGSYEKYRRVYSLGPVQVMFDELPFGDFVEVEGPTLQQVKAQAGRLGLAWNRRIRSTYLEIFSQLRSQYSLRFREAEFDRFAAHPEARADRIGLRDAIRPEAGER